MVNLVVSFWLNYRIQGHFIRYKARAGSAAPQSQVSHRAPEPHSGRAALWWMAKDGKGDIFRQIERVELYFALITLTKITRTLRFWLGRGGSLVWRSLQYLSVQKIGFLAILRSFNCTLFCKSSLIAEHFNNLRSNQVCG